MTPVKTGANVFLEEYGAIAHGDLYKIAGVYFLNQTGIPYSYRMDFNPEEGTLVNINVSRIAGRVSDFIIWAEESSDSFDYEGIPWRKQGKSEE
jgi:hypothetical protein